MWLMASFQYLTGVKFQAWQFALCLFANKGSKVQKISSAFYNGIHFIRAGCSYAPYIIKEQSICVTYWQVPKFTINYNLRKPYLLPPSHSSL